MARAIAKSGSFRPGRSPQSWGAAPDGRSGIPLKLASFRKVGADQWGGRPRPRGSPWSRPLAPTRGSARRPGGLPHRLKLASFRLGRSLWLRAKTADWRFGIPLKLGSFFTFSDSLLPFVRHG
jgi:hypothetical protein